nr:hypothetical protein [Pseudomonas fluorescens]
MNAFLGNEHEDNRRSWKQPGDVMVFGFSAEEADRLDDFANGTPTDR